jgi:hypothetical protein
MTVAWSDPVTPLAAFALGSGFDRWDAINAPNLVSPPATPTHADMDAPATAG